MTGHDLIRNEIKDIFVFIENLLSEKKISLKDSYFNLGGFSGGTFEANGVKIDLSLALILGDSGYILRRRFELLTDKFEQYDHFDLNGQLTFSSEKESLEPIIVDFNDFDLNPYLNHLYNYLSIGYKKTNEGINQTKLIYSIETFLNKLAKSKKISLGGLQGAFDPAMTLILEKMLLIEKDLVLNWTERQISYEKSIQKMDTILAVKARAHKKNPHLRTLPLSLRLLKNRLQRLVLRPVDNLSGLTYKYTVGKVFWFFRTVKNNLGYSVALAVYGPFTYYFITMPMNPHAMQAVGRVRSYYLEVKEQLLSKETPQAETSLAVSQVIQKSPLTIEPVKTAETTDIVSTKAAAPLINIIYPSEVTTRKAPLYQAHLPEDSFVGTTPKYLNMPLTTDNPKVDAVGWQKRMSSFKQMQIAYEENIEYASRMGRLEQLETQYNFPMQVESTWYELERYNEMLFKARSENSQLTAKMKQYIFNEINRTQQLQLYLWDRMNRFIQDQIYVMLDQDKEQKRNDYYVGRSFVFFEEMTSVLSWRYKGLEKPTGYDKIKTLAEFYQSKRIESGSVTKNLQANSDLFKQKDPLSTKEFRSYMKRQWEILFLQNSKAEEASNMGLNMYIWSVRNTIWSLQSIYSAKREEFPLLVKKDLTGQFPSADEALSRQKAALLYETFVHNLTLEYVGIKDEIKNHLAGDIESHQREIVIENLREFLSDRDKLDNVQMATNTQEIGTKK